MTKKVVILTGNEMRHDFFRMLLASYQSVEVLKSYCEVTKDVSKALMGHSDEITDEREKHLNLRLQTESDFFGSFVENVIDRSNPSLIVKGEINNPLYVTKIINMNPDLIIAYGCSIITSDLLAFFKGRFINIHLGLSPYYRGSATNFWPFVNKELACVGVTFMHIDEGVDTGEIIHQQRAVMHKTDSIHSIGCRLIKDMTLSCIKIIERFPVRMPHHISRPTPDVPLRFCRKRDFTEDSVVCAYRNLKHGLIDDYLANKSELDKMYPLIRVF